MEEFTELMKSIAIAAFWFDIALLLAGTWVAVILCFIASIFSGSHDKTN